MLARDNQGSFPDSTTCDNNWIVAKHFIHDIRLELFLSSKMSVEVDFIVVGGGSAGAVIATRLTEDPKLELLLLECGPNDHALVLEY